MPVIKATWLFNGGGRATIGFGLTTAQGKVYGFSESWYTSLTGDNLIATMDIMSEARRQILSANTAIVGYRIGQPTGRSFVVRRFFVAPQTNDSNNLPVDAALVQVKANIGPSIKKFWLHDLPDDWIVSGDIVQARKNAIKLVVDAYIAGQFQIRCTDDLAPKASVLSIDAAGVVKTVQNIALAVGDYITFLKCRDINNKAIRGTYVVETVTDAKTFKVAHWGGNIVVQKGTVRKQNYFFAGAVTMGAATVIGGGSRKVGRPFFQSRGRVPARR